MACINRSACVIAVILILLVVDQLKGQSIFLHGIDNSLLRRKQFEETKGSVYLNELWSLGTLISKEGNEYSGLLLRFDAYQDLIEVNQNDQIMVASAAEIPTFILTVSEMGTNETKKQFFMSGYNFELYDAHNYFEVLAQGKIDLLVRYKISFLEGNVSKYGTPGSYRSYQLNRLYYVVDKRSFYNEIKPSRKSVYKVFPKYVPEIEKFLESNKLKLKSEADLIEVIKFLNSR